MRATGVVLLEVLRVQLWVVPTVAALLAAVLALLVVRLDGATDALGLPLDIDAQSARAVLSAISGAMISFTALVFSVTMLVLQTASTQLSPRVVRTFLRDRFNQVVMGLFVATFIFSLLVLTTVGEDDVPQLGVVVAVGLVLIAVLAFVAYIDHMAHDIRPTSVIESITAETCSVIERVYPDGEAAGPDGAAVGVGAGAEGPAVTWSGAAGYVQAFDRDGLLGFAAKQGAGVELQVGIGEFLVRGQSLLRVGRRASGSDPADEVGLESVDLEDLVRVGPERTMTEDPEFGLRQLVDVALRALSPSLNDPSTAVQVVDRLHELLRELQPRTIASPMVWRDGSAPPVIVPAPDWEAFVHLATFEIGLAAGAQPRVRQHLLGMLDALLREATPDQRAAIHHARSELEGMGDRSRTD